MGPRLVRGQGYLVLGPIDRAPGFAQVLAKAREATLWITHRQGASLPDSGEILRVTTLDGAPGTVDPRRVMDLRAAVARFLDARGPGTIVLDCLDVLGAHGGPERVVRALEDLHEEVALRGAVLAVFADPETANPRMLAWLEREFEIFPRAADPRGDEARLLA